MLLHIAAMLIFIQAVLPILWVLRTSLSYESELTKRPINWLPEKVTVANYEKLFGLRPITLGTPYAAKEFRISLFNTVIVALATSFLALVIGSMAAYSFARLLPAGRQILLVGLVFTQMMPAMGIAIPLFVTMRKLGLLNTLAGLIIVYLSFTLPFTIWILQGYFSGIPRDLEDAALIDGCTRIGAFLRIIIPTSTSGLVAVSILAFMGAWSNFFFALIFTRTLKSRVLTVTISLFCTEAQVDIPLSNTAGLLATIPPLILALCLQKYIVKGLTAGAVKG